MSEKTWVSALTLLGSLSSYYYAKSQERDAVPYVMIGGFVGAIAGEMIARAFTDKDRDTKKPPHPDTTNTHPSPKDARKQSGTDTAHTPDQTTKEK